jgi:hypothetical protein
MYNWQSVRCCAALGCRQGDRIRSWRSGPKCSPTRFLLKHIHSIFIFIEVRKCWLFFVVFKSLPKVNNHPMGENSSKLVALAAGKQADIASTANRVSVCPFVSSSFFWLLSNFVPFRAALRTSLNWSAAIGLASSVTRLGEFSLIGWLYTLGSLFV